MKNILLLSISLLFSITAFSQEITFADIQCDDMTQALSFRVTWTDANGNFEVIESGTGVSVRIPDTAPNLGEFLFEFDKRDVPMNDLLIETTIQFAGGRTCDELIGQELEFVNYETSRITAVFGDAGTAIPTVGQWALFVLALIMSSLGVAALRNKKLVAE